MNEDIALPVLSREKGDTVRRVAAGQYPISYPSSPVRVHAFAPIGQPISTIMDRFGPPSRVSFDGKGGTVYT